MQFNIPAEHKNASGIYIIRNSVNSKVYVGSAKSFYERYHGHCNRLKHNKHHSPLLQRFAAKYGMHTLSFELLELTGADKVQLIPAEQKWLDLIKPYLVVNGFNILPIANSRAGVPLSEETRAKLSVINKGKSPSVETRRKLSESLKGRQVSEETRQKLSVAGKGRRISEAQKQFLRAAAKERLPCSEETRQKLSDAGKGRKLNAYQRATLLAANTGRVMSDETRRKISEANTGKKHSPEIKAKISQKSRGRIVSDKTRESISLALKGRRLSTEQKDKLALKRRPFSAEHKANISEAAKRRCAANPDKLLQAREARRAAKNNTQQLCIF